MRLNLLGVEILPFNQAKNYFCENLIDLYEKNDKNKKYRNRTS